LVLAAALAGCAFVPPAAAKKAAVPAISVETLKEATRVLSGDDFEGRAPGTAGEEKTLAYLRQTVVNLSRSALRRRILGLKLLSKPMPDMASAEEGAYDLLERDSLIKAMKGLQRRQREVLVLRYFADMTEAQVAETLGISLGSVKAYGSRGIAALRVAMEEPA
jgi:RNA polymerase sigma factor (sigma-70 family)